MKKEINIRKLDTEWIMPPTDESRLFVRYDAIGFEVFDMYTQITFKCEGRVVYTVKQHYRTKIEFGSATVTGLTGFAKIFKDEEAND